MIITMNKTANDAEINRIINQLEAKNYTPRTSVNGCVHIAALGKGEAIDWDILRRNDGVAKIESPEQRIFWRVGR